MLKPEHFLNAKGIDLKKTALLTEMGGYMRQPDLCYLMDEYAKAKLRDIAEKAEKDELTDEYLEWMDFTKPIKKSPVEKVDVSLEPGTGHV